MAFRIIPPNDPPKPRLVTFFNPTNGKPLGTVKLPATKKSHWKSHREQEAETLKMFAGDVYARLN